MSIPFSSRFLVPTYIALLLGCSPSPRCAENDTPTVKLSDSGLCQVRGTSSYGATLHFEAFETLADCINAGGRLPKTSRHPIQATQGLPAQSIASKSKESPGVAVIRSIPSRDIAIGAVLVIAVGILVAFVRFRARRYPRVQLKRVVGKQGDALRSSTTVGPSADELRLLKACLGSAEVAERLIQFELERNPTLSRGRAAAAAVRRIKRDNK